jgi:hypothetical protein
VKQLILTEVCNDDIDVVVNIAGNHLIAWVVVGVCLCSDLQLFAFKTKMVTHMIHKHTK